METIQSKRAAASAPVCKEMTKESRYVVCERCNDRVASPGHQVCVFCLGDLEKLKLEWDIKHKEEKK